MLQFAEKLVNYNQNQTLQGINPHLGNTTLLPPGNLFESGPGAPARNGCPCCCCSLSKFCSRFCCLLYKYTRYLFINLLFPLRHRCAIYLRRCGTIIAEWNGQKTISNGNSFVSRVENRWSAISFRLTWHCHGLRSFLLQKFRKTVVGLSAW